MKTLFTYNWMIREEWYKWCEDVPLEELLKNRTGGVGGILHTLFHIIDASGVGFVFCKVNPIFKRVLKVIRA